MRKQNTTQQITHNKFDNSPVVVTNIVKGGLVTKDPNAVKYGLHEVTRYSGPFGRGRSCLLYTSPSPRDQRGSRMPSSA